MGLGLAEPGFHTRAYVEWEEYPRQCLIAAQRAGYLAPAPIWDDLTTFDARPLAGAIDTLLAGYPCQPFSAAGQRRGADDPRHLWPHVARVAKEIGDGLRWIFLENVAGHISLGLETVLRDLWHMGFTPAAGAFSAAETGATHERLRIFIVAYADGRDTRAEWQQRGGQQRFQQAGRGTGNATMGHPGANANPRGLDSLSDFEGASASEGEGQGQERQRVRDWSGRASVGAMADTGQPGLQGRERRGTPDKWNGAAASGSTAQCRRPYLHPPGPGDSAAWAHVLAADPAGAPTFARRDAAAAALRLASLLSPAQAGAVERTARGLEIEGILAAMEREAPDMVEQTTAVAGIRDLAYGLAVRSRALRLLGNGVHPLAAGHAWRALSHAHGLRPLDLAAD